MDTKDVQSRRLLDAMQTITGKLTEQQDRVMTVLQGEQLQYADGGSARKTTMIMETGWPTGGRWR